MTELYNFISTQSLRALLITEQGIKNKHQKKSCVYTHVFNVSTETPTFGSKMNMKC